MTQDEIIEMARQAGLIVNSPYLMPHDHVMRGIEAFAKLVEEWAVAKEREACIELIKSHGPTLANGFMLTEAIRARSISRGEA